MIETVLLSAGLMVIAEACLRLHRFRFAPTRLRLLYAAFCLRPDAVQAIHEIHQRAVRTGVRTFDGVFELYARASGRSKADIETLFGLSLPRRELNQAELVLRNRLQWHVGLVPLPGQRLRTISTDDQGMRRVCPDASDYSDKPVRVVLLSGGSVTFGFGATSDGSTVAGRLEHHLNRLDKTDQYRWKVINLGVPGATSFQEMIVFLQYLNGAGPPRHVISISGWNDVDHQFHGGVPNVSVLAQNLTEELEGSSLTVQAARRLSRRSVLLSSLKRFVDSYECWPGPYGMKTHTISHTPGRQRELQGSSDIYPLW